jgi:hypothetical protein
LETNWKKICPFFSTCVFHIDLRFPWKFPVLSKKRPLCPFRVETNWADSQWPPRTASVAAKKVSPWSGRPDEFVKKITQNVAQSISADISA